MWKALVKERFFIFALIAVVVLSIVGPILPRYYTQLLTLTLITALFATSLNIEIGYAGMMPLGQATFYGLGAYSFGLLVIKAHLPIFPAVICGLLISMIISVIIGYLCIRRNLFIFGLLHLAFNIVFITLVSKWVNLTGGSSGFTATLRPAFLSSYVSFYFFVLVMVVVAYAIIKILVESPFGKIAQGMRENEERLNFLGVNTKRFQLVLFVASGFFAALAGVLLAMNNNGIYPAYFALTVSVQGLMMVIIGGMYFFIGPTLGALLVTIFSTEVSNFTSYWQGWLGVVMVIWVTRFKEGILFRRQSKASKKIPAIEMNK